MPAKKSASKKRKAGKASRKKVAKSRTSARKKTASKKRKTTRKKGAARKSSRKKAASRKKPAGKKRAKKKSKAKKKGASKKKTTKKKRVTKKKAAKKKAAARKKVSKKKVSKKKVSKKKPAAKKKAATMAPNRNKAAVTVLIRQKSKARRRDILSGPYGVEPYTVKRGEEYMSQGQLKHFELILSNWKKELMQEVDRTVHHMQDEAANFPDPNDRATQESEFGLELRTRDRERKLLRKINAALARIEEGSYGYCDETGEEIGLKRLEARPVATLCVEAQERRELAERQFRDRDDRYR